MCSHRVATLDLHHDKSIPVDLAQVQRPLSKSAIERRRVQQRRRRVGSMFEQMSKILSQTLNGDMGMMSLLSFANLVAEKHALHIDRSAKRTKEGLICWFCEFASVVVPQLIRRTSTKESPDCVASESTAEPPSQSTDSFESFLSAWTEQELQNDGLFTWESEITFD
jgi:hypothetical protein